MSEHRTPEPPRLITMGLGMRQVRTRMECLRMAADAGGDPQQILDRAQAFVSHIEAATEDVLDRRWTCLRMASQLLETPEDGDGIIRTAIAFEGFVFGRLPQAPS